LNARLCSKRIVRTRKLKKTSSVSPLISAGYSKRRVTLSPASVTLTRGGSRNPGGAENPGTVDPGGFERLGDRQAVAAYGGALL
jgi:hypothetical protein